MQVKKKESFSDNVQRALRASGFRPFFFVTGCCEIESRIARSSVYDLSRLGVQVAENPQEADVLVAGGWINLEYEKKILRIFDLIQPPKFVIGIGACAISATPYLTAGNKKVLSDLVPVDVFVSGCPPHAEAFLEAMLQLKIKISPDPDQRTVLQTAMKTNTVQV